MSYQRYAKRTDKTQAEIVEAIKKAGWSVWIIGRPVDLLCWRPDRGFRCLECKTAQGKKNPKARIDKRQKEQNDFIETTGTGRVCTAFEALLALGETIDL